MSPALISSVALLASFCSFAHAQTLVRGQVYTNGLAIVDAPAPNSPLHAGSQTLQVAIDVSGNGKLPNWQTASVPGSDLPTRYDGLEIYLVSYQTNLNITVAAGPDLLTREAGSTVKHWDFDVSSCIPAGQYNLTFYEWSHINNEPFFSITPLPVEVMNSQPGKPCMQGMNELATSPQPSSPPPHTPWLDGTDIVDNPSLSSAPMLHNPAILLSSASAILLSLCTLL